MLNIGPIYYEEAMARKVELFKTLSRWLASIAFLLTDGSPGNGKPLERQQQQHSGPQGEQALGAPPGISAGGQPENNAQPEDMDDQASLSSVGTEPLEEGLSQDAANIRKGASGLCAHR